MDGNGFARIGSIEKKLKNFPERERALWRVFDTTPFEQGVAAGNRDGILERLSANEMIRKSATGGWRRSGFVRGAKVEGED